MTKNDIDMATAFAHVEILELKAGRRGITQCPGIEQLAKAAAEERQRLLTDKAISELIG